MSYTTIRVNKHARDFLVKQRRDDENLAETLDRLLGEGMEAFHE